MPMKQNNLCEEICRHTEYYDMQKDLDYLYEKSKNNGVFDNLIDLILKEENILLAYRNMKSNTGSNTQGTDGKTIKDIEKMVSEEVIDMVRYILIGSKHGYRPKPVRRKNIPKPNGKTRPLGISCIWDRLIQQCIKQVIEPICEAKFSDNSFGFRPNRSVENAIQKSYCMMQLSKMHYVIEFDIEGFFDNVNHSKLIKQIWAMGIHDKTLIYIIKQILKAPIKMPNGDMIKPEKGTPQGGIISPLLANIVLNELDQWIDSQWQNNPVTEKYHIDINKNGTKCKSTGFRAMRKTKLKEMHIVRYADDFRIYCTSEENAKKIMIATTKWLEERLKLKVSKEKTRIVNVEKEYSEFLGFKIKLRRKGQKLVVVSRMSDKTLKKSTQKLIQQIKNIQRPRKGKNQYEDIALYNLMVMGIQNYYKIATDIIKDCKYMQYRIYVLLKKRFKKRISRDGRELNPTEQKLYGKSQMIRYLKGVEQPIYPIGYIQCKKPMAKPQKVNIYTPEGRKEIHSNLQINMNLMKQMMKQKLYKNSIEYRDNRLSLFSAQNGKCAVTGELFKELDEIHCHHKKPKHLGGTDKYQNLIIVLEEVHILIHATQKETINKYMNILQLKKLQIAKINQLREEVGNFEI